MPYIIYKVKLFSFIKALITHNIARDELNAQRLDTLSWTVITVWECELSKKNRDATIARIEADLRAAKDKYDKWTALRRESREYAREQARSIAKSSPRSKPSWACRNPSAATRKRPRRKNSTFVIISVSLTFAFTSNKSFSGPFEGPEKMSIFAMLIYA